MTVADQVLKKLKIIRGTALAGDQNYASHSHVFHKGLLPSMVRREEE